MAMTPKGIYFPEGTTNANFVSIFSTLANSVDSALGDFTYDSGWIEVSTAEMLNNWETYNTSGSRVRYRKIGKTVYLDGIARRGSNGDILNFPVGFRPNSVYTNHAGVIVSSSGKPTARLRVNSSNGNLEQFYTTQSERNYGIGLNSVVFISD